MSAGLSEQARERMSGLVDGEGSPEELQQLMGGGRDSREAWSETLQSWHVYHLIGDVMRSDELAGQGHDDQFLARLRERLAEEPVVVAPLAATKEDRQAPELQVAQGGGRASTRRRTWRAPLAAAAGVMMVAGVVTMTGLPDPQGGRLPGGSETLAQSTAALVPSQKAPPPRLVTASAPLVRDARLEQYLSAHKQFGGSSAIGVPSGFLRSATYEGPTR